MKKAFITLMALTLCAGAFAKEAEKSAVKQHIDDHFKIYGFIRNYFAYDSRESTAGTGDLYYWFPKDVSVNTAGEDVNAISSFRFLALTSRLGLDVFDYKAGGYKFGAKIEADFYAGLSGSTGTATLRLRQAYATVDKKWRNWKIGQAWHPMAADLPDIFSLESGAPFNCFSRTPQVTFTAKLPAGLSITASALWQMQYTSTGPEGASSTYIEHSCTPEGYLALNWQNKNVLMRLGGDVLSIKPYSFRTDVSEVNKNYGVKVKDRVTTCSVYQYGQFKMGSFMLKEKITFGNDGSHMNLIGGYGKSGVAADGISYTYNATNNLSSWATLMWKSKNGKWVPSLFVGYIKNFGTGKMVDPNLSWVKNSASSINQMYRIQPEVLYNIGKFQIGLEYMYTSVNYGKTDKSWLRATENLHWVDNHRVQALIKFNF